MQLKSNYLLCISVMLQCFIVSCSKDSPTESSSKTTAICFTVSGFQVTIHNMWKNGSTSTQDVRGLLSFDQTLSQNNETHSLKWSNIANDYTFYTVRSFTVKIDGKEYQYPKNKCGLQSKISFTLNEKSYQYLECTGLRSYPYGTYSVAYDNIPEQYNVSGSKSYADGSVSKNTIHITFANEGNDAVWSLWIAYYDENGKEIFFHSTVDISILKNRDVIGGQMSASIAGPLKSDNHLYTLEDLKFEAERVELP